jgi:anaerobic magnesium-protoporphyrin IX monomethyl ester cyclase
MKIERVMLIRPGVRFSRPGFAQPLGLLYLISLLRKQFPDKFEIDLVEQALYDLSFDQMRERIRNFDPDLVGFSAMSVEANEMAELARIVKELKPSCPTILGGPHASVFYDYVLKDTNIDYVVIGEGERTFLELLPRLENDEPLDDVKGLAFKRDGDGDMVVTPAREFIENLDSIPLPAWDLVDFQRYSVQISMNAFCHSTPWAIIFTTRACPFQCAYCHNIFGKKVRKRSVENVMEEIEILTGRYGVKELHIVDDIFNIDLPRAKRICDEIVERGIKVKLAFPNGLRGDMMDRELIKKLKAAGCYAITYAVETASPRLQKAIRKNLNLDKVKQAIAWTDEEGIIPQGFFMLGFPGETIKEMNMTVKYALESKLLRAWFFEVVVYPRTGLFEMAQKIYPDLDFSNWEMFELRYWAEKVQFYTRATGVDLFKIVRNAYRRFLLRPKTNIKIIWRFPKNIFLFRGMYWGLRSVFISLYRFERIFRPVRKWLNRHFGLFPE